MPGVFRLFLRKTHEMPEVFRLLLRKTHEMLGVFRLLLRKTHEMPEVFRSFLRKIGQSTPPYKTLLIAKVLFFPLTETFNMCEEPHFIYFNYICTILVQIGGHPTTYS